MIQDEKQRLRAVMRQLICERRHEDEDASQAFRDTLVTLPEWLRSKTILLYAPLHGEVNLMPILQKEKDHRFIFPKIMGNDIALYYCDSESILLPGPFALQEPDPASCQQASVSEIDLAAIPGLAFDLAGGRLGRGKGFYDRLLGHPDFQGAKIGICWQWQIIPSTPCESHDVLMDKVIFY